MSKIKKGDKVVVITGKDKGRQGIVNKTISSYVTRKGKCIQKFKVIVDGVNIVKRHTKPTSQENSGGILEKEAPIDISNIAIFNAAVGKADRIGFKILEDGRKVRIFKSTGEVVDI